MHYMVHDMVHRIVLIVHCIVQDMVHGMQYIVHHMVHDAVHHTVLLYSKGAHAVGRQRALHTVHSASHSANRQNRQYMVHHVVRFLCKGAHAAGRREVPADLELSRQLLAGRRGEEHVRVRRGGLLRAAGG